MHICDDRPKHLQLEEDGVSGDRSELTFTDDEGIVVVTWVVYRENQVSNCGP
jgi:hypothetical protein